MMRRGIQPLNQPEAAPRRVPPADSVGELARFPLVRWIVGEVAAWASGALGLGSEVAAALRAADIDGEALASLTEHDMQALGIEPFGSRRRLTLRVADPRCGGGPAASKDATAVASDSRGRDG